MSMSQLQCWKVYVLEVFDFFNGVYLAKVPSSSLLLDEAVLAWDLLHDFFISFSVSHSHI